MMQALEKVLNVLILVYYIWLDQRKMRCNMSKEDKATDNQNNGRHGLSL